MWNQILFEPFHKMRIAKCINTIKEKNHSLMSESLGKLSWCYVELCFIWFFFLFIHDMYKIRDTIDARNICARVSVHRMNHVHAERSMWIYANKLTTLGVIMRRKTKYEQCASHLCRCWNVLHKHKLIFTMDLWFALNRRNTTPFCKMIAI